jgi:hypothetical protein
MQFCFPYFQLRPHLFFFAKPAVLLPKHLSAVGSGTQFLTLETHSVDQSPTDTQQTSHERFYLPVVS